MGLFMENGLNVVSHHFKYENADEPEKFFQQKVTASGSYKHTAYDKDDKEHIGQFDAGEVRAYTQRRSFRSI
jgi:hypothetical protein